MSSTKPRCMPAPAPDRTRPAKPSPKNILHSFPKPSLFITGRYNPYSCMTRQRMFIWGILILNGIIILDSFLLSPVQRDEIYKMRSSVWTHGGYRTYPSYTTDYLVTQSGH